MTRVGPGLSETFYGRALRSDAPCLSGSSSSI